MDLAANVVEHARRDPQLAGIQFSVRDILAPNFADEMLRRFDVIVINGVLQYFDKEQFAGFMSQVSKLLSKSGFLIVFDYYQKYEQDLEIVERSERYPAGLRRYLFSYQTATRLLQECGLGNVEFRPFMIPIDLAETPAGYENVTHTVKLATGDRLSFLGAIYQPWCFLTAEKV